MTRLFFATDIHGSEVCWRKFLNAAKFYRADVLVLGGDMTGKALVPITQLPDGSFKATLLQQEYRLEDEEQVREMEKRVGSRGYYPCRVTPKQLAEFATEPSRVESFFRQRMLELLEQWMALADQRLDGSSVRCYVCPGNDDTFETDEVIRRSRRVELAEGRAVDLGEGFSMVSTGWSNITPWHTCRELTEADLAAKIEGMLPPQGDMSRMVFNFHCPPHASGLDEAPALDQELNLLDAGRSLIPVGSTAVRQAIERHQPLLSLHGHIHEGKGIARMGRTLCINAGSLYEQGTLQGAVVELDRRKGIRSYMLTTG